MDSRNSKSGKSRAGEGAANEGGDGLIASTEIASELKTAFSQYAKVRSYIYSCNSNVRYLI